MLDIMKRRFEKFKEPYSDMEHLLNDMAEYDNESKSNNVNLKASRGMLKDLDLDKVVDSHFQTDYRDLSGKEVISKLEDIRELIKSKDECTVCMENQRSIVFMPCGHLICCQDCVKVLTKCPICRAEIESTIVTERSC